MGVGAPQGMVFEPGSGDLYFAEQEFGRLWRVRFGAPPPDFADYPGFCSYSAFETCGASPDASCAFTIPGGTPVPGIRVRRCVDNPDACSAVNAEIWVDDVHVGNTGGLDQEGCSPGIDVTDLVGGAASFTVELRNPVCLSGCCCGGTPGTLAPNWIGEIQADDSFFPAECGDGIDNDADGLTDFAGGDPGCSHGEDEAESANHLPCDNEIDDDADGDIDLVDLECGVPGDPSEHPAPGLPTCDDAIDNDRDGLTDLADPGCDDATDLFETDAGLACDNFADDDGDGLVDLVDPDCEDAADPSEAPACSDGVDNDGDGLVDAPADFGCTDADDRSETDPALPCDDGVDNDGDGFIDIDALGSTGDPGCFSGVGTTEATQCQDGLNNDSDSLIDFDGGQSIHGACSGDVCPPGVSDPNLDGVADPDPQCVDRPWYNQEGFPKKICGIGGAWAFALLIALWRRRR